jgi:ketosteroid isomerase-like protein
MRSSTSAIIAFVLTAVAVNIAGAQSSEAEARQELVALEERWGEAIRDGDAAAIEPILGDELIYTGPDGERSTKAEELRAITAGDSDVSEFETGNIEVRLYGDVAVVLGEHAQKGTYKDEDTSGRYRWTEVFVRRDGRWQVVAGQIAKVAEEAR